MLWAFLLFATLASAICPSRSSFTVTQSGNNWIFDQGLLDTNNANDGKLICFIKGCTYLLNISGPHPFVITTTNPNGKPPTNNNNVLAFSPAPGYDNNFTTKCAKPTPCQVVYNVPIDAGEKAPIFYTSKQNDQNGNVNFYEPTCPPWVHRCSPRNRCQNCTAPCGLCQNIANGTSVTCDATNCITCANGGYLSDPKSVSGSTCVPPIIPNIGPPIYQLDLPGISSPRVEMVIVGAGTFIPEVGDIPNTTPNMKTFIQNYVISSNYAMINDYSTLGIFELGTVRTAGQNLTTGTFGSVSHLDFNFSSNIITLQSLLDALAKAISVGNPPPLPVPQYDSLGDVNSIYTLFLPQGIRVTDPTIGDSCSEWCADHGVISLTLQGLKRFVPFIILPDNSPGQTFNCFDFCGGTTNLSFFNLQSTFTHELNEAAAINFNYQTGAENADICQDLDQLFKGPLDNVTYNSQRIDSVNGGKCQGNRQTNFALVSLNYQYQSFYLGDAVTYTIQTISFTQASVQLQITLQYLPAGWSFSISPQTVYAGQSFKLTIQSNSVPLPYHPIISIQATEITSAGVLVPSNNCQIKVEALCTNVANGAFKSNFSGWVFDFPNEFAVIEPVFNSATLVASPAPLTQTSSISQLILVNFISINITFRITCGYYTNDPIPVLTLTNQDVIGEVGLKLRDHSITKAKVSLNCTAQPYPESKQDDTAPLFYVTLTLDTTNLKGQLLNLTLYASRTRTNLNHTVIGEFYKISTEPFPPFVATTPMT